MGFLDSILGMTGTSCAAVQSYINSALTPAQLAAIKNSNITIGNVKLADFYNTVTNDNATCTALVQCNSVAAAIVNDLINNNIADLTKQANDPCVKTIFNQIKTLYASNPTVVAYIENILRGSTPPPVTPPPVTPPPATPLTTGSTTSGSSYNNVVTNTVTTSNTTTTNINNTTNNGAQMVNMQIIFISFICVATLLVCKAVNLISYTYLFVGLTIIVGLDVMIYMAYGRSISGFRNYPKDEYAMYSADSSLVVQNLFTGVILVSLALFVGFKNKKISKDTFLYLIALMSVGSAIVVVDKK